MAPTYLYIVLILGMVGVGLARLATGTLPDYTPPAEWLIRDLDVDAAGLTARPGDPSGRLALRVRLNESELAALVEPQEPTPSATAKLRQERPDDLARPDSRPGDGLRLAGSTKASRSIFILRTPGAPHDRGRAATRNSDAAPAWRGGALP